MRKLVLIFSICFFAGSTGNSLAQTDNIYYTPALDEYRSENQGQSTIEYSEAEKRMFAELEKLQKSGAIKQRIAETRLYSNFHPAIVEIIDVYNSRSKDGEFGDKELELVSDHFFRVAQHVRPSTNRKEINTGMRAAIKRSNGNVANGALSYGISLLSEALAFRQYDVPLLMLPAFHTIDPNLPNALSVHLPYSTPFSPLDANPNLSNLAWDYQIKAVDEFVSQDFFNSQSSFHSANSLMRSVMALSFGMADLQRVSKLRSEALATLNEAGIVGYKPVLTKIDSAYTNAFQPENNNNLTSSNFFALATLEAPGEPSVEPDGSITSITQILIDPRTTTQPDYRVPEDFNVSLNPSSGLNPNSAQPSLLTYTIPESQLTFASAGGKFAGWLVEVIVEFVSGTSNVNPPSSAVIDPYAPPGSQANPIPTPDGKNFAPAPENNPDNTTPETPVPDNTPPEPEAAPPAPEEPDGVDGGDGPETTPPVLAGGGDPEDGGDPDDDPEVAGNVEPKEPLNKNAERADTIYSLAVYSSKRLTRSDQSELAKVIHERIIPAIERPNAGTESTSPIEGGPPIDLCGYAECFSKTARGVRIQTPSSRSTTSPLIVDCENDNACDPAEAGWIRNSLGSSLGGCVQGEDIINCAPRTNPGTLGVAEPLIYGGGRKCFSAHSGETIDIYCTPDTSGTVPAPITAGPE